MGEVFLNGRRAVEHEVAAVEHGRRCDRDRDLQLLAGVLTGEPVPLHASRRLHDLPAIP